MVTTKAAYIHIQSIFTATSTGGQIELSSLMADIVVDIQK
jgi:hypothetical protein